MSKKDFLTLKDFSQQEILHLLNIAISYKAAPHRYRNALNGHLIGMIFEKPSTRTRVSLEGAALRLGAHAIYLSPRDTQLGRGESIEDTSKVLSRYVDLITARVFSHASLEALAKKGSIPVINALSDRFHPAQVLADLMTLKEHKGMLDGLVLTFVGDGSNNMAASLAIGGAIVGMEVRIATPKAYQPAQDVIDFVNQVGGTLNIYTDPFEAVNGADCVYTDVWVSMGDEAQKQQRLNVFAPFQVNLALFEEAKKDAVFMHCLPAHRGQEVTSEVADHPRSIIFDEAENRLHTAAALYLNLLLGQ